MQRSGRLFGALIGMDGQILARAPEQRRIKRPPYLKFITILTLGGKGERYGKILTVRI